VSATGWNLGLAGAATIAGAAGDRLAGLQSLRAATANVARAARPAAYYAVDLSVPLLAGSSMTSLHGVFLVSPRGVATRCLTGTNVNTCGPKPVTIFAASPSTAFGAGSDVVQVQYGRASATSRVVFRVGVRQSAGSTGIVYGNWTNVPAAATYTVTVDWSNSRTTVRVNATGLSRPAGAALSTNRIKSVGIGVLNTIPSVNPGQLGQTGYVLFDSVTLS
jgi:hypothetical protein